MNPLNDYYFHYHPMWYPYLHRHLDSAPIVDEPGDPKTGQVGSPISLVRLLVALCCPLGVCLFAWSYSLNIEKKILVGVVRSAAQLFFAGYVLLGFIFATRHVAVVAAYIFVMCIIGGMEATARQVRLYDGHFFDSFLAVSLSGAVMGTLCTYLVLAPHPWWSPEIVVPTVGMLIGNALNGPAVAVDRFLATVTEQKYELETRLAFGSTGYEAAIPIVRSSIVAALMSSLNMMSTVGIVSIPGMMTGQLLGGASPLVAAEYQLMIIWLICSTVSISTFISLAYAMKNATFDVNHRLTYHKIIKKGKKEIEQVFVNGVKDAAKYLYSTTFMILERINAVQMTLGLSGGDTISSADSSSHQGIGGVLASDDIEMTSSGALLVENPSKASFVLLKNPLAQLDLSDGNTADGKTIFEATNVNIISGDTTLFPSGGVSFTLQCGELMSLEGPSGLGKTRFLRAIAQLDPLKDGVVNLFDIVGSDNDSTPGTPTSASSTASSIAPVYNPLAHSATDHLPVSTAMHQSKGVSALLKIFNCIIGLINPFAQLQGNTAIPKYRRRVIYVPQALPPMNGTPKDFILEISQYISRRRDARAKTVREELDARLAEMESSLALGEGKLTQEWAVLSGGERQRAVIGCGLIAASMMALPNSSPSITSERGKRSKPVERSPVLLLLDEPTAACDAESCVAVERAIQASGVAAIIITHDERQAVRLCHKRLRLTANA